MHLEDEIDEFDRDKHDWFLESIKVDKVDAFSNRLINSLTFPCKSWVGRKKSGDDIGAGKQ